VFSSGIARVPRGPDAGGERYSGYRDGKGRVGDCVKPTDDLCGGRRCVFTGTGCGSGEDGRQRERVVFTRPVTFRHVFLILEGTAVQGRTAGSARECGRHFVLCLFELVG
jgi:hypothetical protein